MDRSYDDLSKTWRVELSPDVRDELALHENVYSLGLQIMDLREERGLTQSQLAEKCGLEKADVIDIESGAAQPSDITVIRVANALGVEIRMVARELS